MRLLTRWDDTTAHVCFEEVVSAFRETGDARTGVMALVGLVALAAQAGDLAYDLRLASATAATVVVPARRAGPTGRGAPPN